MEEVARKFTVLSPFVGTTYNFFNPYSFGAHRQFPPRNYYGQGVTDDHFPGDYRSNGHAFLGKKKELRVPGKRLR
jgi:hypothetical protein